MTQPGPPYPSPPRSLRVSGQLVRYARGTYLYQPSDRLVSLFVLRSGYVKVGAYGPEGRERVYDVVGPGEFCGNLKYLGGDCFQEFVRALTPVEVFVYDLAGFKTALHGDPAAQEWFTRLMVLRWSRAERRLFRIAALPPAERLDRLLDEVLPSRGAARSLLTQNDLGDLAGLTRQTVAKLLREL